MATTDSNPMDHIVVTNPFTGDVVGSVPRGNVRDVAHAIDAARHRPSLDVDARAEILRAIALELNVRRDEFAHLITSEAGVCLKESAKEVARACGNLTTAAEEAKRIRGEAIPIPGTQGRRMAITMRVPVGVVGALTPYNRPLNQVVVKVAPALAAGNGIVVKPSEKTPLSALAFAELARDCGLPPGTLSIVTGTPDEAGRALATGDVDMITFTGGVQTGHAVARAAAGKRVTLELGGNDPLIVLADADVALAAQIAADQAFATAGQSCRGVKRVIVVDAVADDFVGRLAERAGTKRWGDPLDPATDVGPLIDEPAAILVDDRCMEAVDAGALQVCGGQREGALFAPTVLDRVPPFTDLVVYETLGPVAPVIRVRDTEEAVAMANGTPYGLQAGVITDSTTEFLSVAHSLNVGAVNLMDGPAFDSPHIPFGGVKDSGIGREGIRWAIEEMTTIKTITLPQPTL